MASPLRFNAGPAPATFPAWTKIVGYIGPVKAMGRPAQSYTLGDLASWMHHEARNIEPETLVAVRVTKGDVVVVFPAGFPLRRAQRPKRLSDYRSGLKEGLPPELCLRVYHPVSCAKSYAESQGRAKFLEELRETSRRIGRVGMTGRRAG